jgi:predicted nucleic acid-binding protein
VPVVVDANLLVALAIDDARASAVSEHLRAWSSADEDVHAPTLLFYEVASALTRLIVSGVFASDKVDEAWQTVVAAPIIYHDLADGPQIIDIAQRLSRQSAYDAAYLAFAQELGAELWTFDGPLARNASSIGFTVHLIT